eukprot:scaffold64060_cov69-Phaeocystis_antarctica.AAC.2
MRYGRRVLYRSGPVPWRVALARWRRLYLATSHSSTMGSRTGPAVLVSRNLLLTENLSAAANWRYGGLLRLDRDCFSSFVRRKRSERRWAVDQAVGRAKQGRSTWPCP